MTAPIKVTDADLKQATDDYVAIESARAHLSLVQGLARRHMVELRERLGAPLEWMLSVDTGELVPPPPKQEPEQSLPPPLIPEG
jgi:hypothetical protein